MRTLLWQSKVNARKTVMPDISRLTKSIPEQEGSYHLDNLIHDGIRNLEGIERNTII